MYITQREAARSAKRNERTQMPNAIKCVKAQMVFGSSLDKALDYLLICDTLLSRRQLAKVRAHFEELPTR